MRKLCSEGPPRKLMSLSRKRAIQLTSFILTDRGETIWLRNTPGSDPRKAIHRVLSVSDQRLRLSILFACGVEVAVIAFLFVFLLNHANPLGDGMEMVFVGFAFIRA